MENSKDRLASIINSILGLSREKKKDFIKYFLENTGKTNNVQSDYDEENINNGGYIKNRPFYNSSTENVEEYDLINFAKGRMVDYDYEDVYKMKFGLDFNENKIKIYVIGEEGILTKEYKHNEDVLYTIYNRKFIDTPFKIDYEDSSVSYNDKTFFPIKIKDNNNFIIKVGDENYTSYTGELDPRDKEYKVYVNENINFDNVSIQDFIGIDDENNIKYFDELEDAREYVNTYLRNFEIENKCVIFDFISSDGFFYISLETKLYEVTQIPKEYVYDILERIENIENNGPDLFISSEEKKGYIKNRIILTNGGVGNTNAVIKKVYNTFIFPSIYIKLNSKVVEFRNSYGQNSVINNLADYPALIYKGNPSSIKYQNISYCSLNVKYKQENGYFTSSLYYLEFSYYNKRFVFYLKNDVDIENAGTQDFILYCVRGNSSFYVPNENNSFTVYSDYDSSGNPTGSDSIKFNITKSGAFITISIDENYISNPENYVEDLSKFKLFVAGQVVNVQMTDIMYFKELMNYINDLNERLKLLEGQNGE